MKPGFLLLSELLYPFKRGRRWRQGNTRVTSSRQGCWHNQSPNFASASAEEMLKKPQVYCPPILLSIPEEREGERERWKKKTEQNQLNKTQKYHVWARWQAGSRRKRWIGRAVRCVWEWEGWRLPTQRPAAQ